MRIWKPVSLQGFLLLILSVLLWTSAAGGCARERDAPQAAESAASAGRTRQDFYYEIYHQILNDELLRGVYAPVFTDGDSASLLCEETRYESGTYQERMRLLKSESASFMTVRNARYRQAGGGIPQARWIWRSPGSAVRIWEGLLADFGAVSDRNKEAVAFLCEAGLARLRPAGNAYTLALFPDEPVLQSEADELAAAMRSYARPLPENAVRTCDPEGNEILLCFTDPLSRFTFRSLVSFLEEQKELEHSFVYFNETGTDLSLWINTASGGMVAVPLDFARGNVCELPYSANTAMLRQRQEIAAALLPECCRSQFLSDAAQVLQNPDRQYEFYYEDGTAGYSAVVSYRFPGGSAGTIRVGIAGN